MTQKPHDPNIQRNVNSYIFNLYQLLKHYENIKSSVDDWNMFIEDMDKRIINGQVTFSYNEQVKCLNFLNSAIYASGLTKIEWDEDDIDEIEDTRRAR